MTASEARSRVSKTICGYTSYKDMVAAVSKKYKLFEMYRALLEDRRAQDRRPSNEENPDLLDILWDAMGPSQRAKAHELISQLEERDNAA